MKYSKNHTCYYNSKKDEVPSATTILKILNKPSLVHWANYLGFKGERVSDVLEETSKFGTLIHSIVEAYVLNKYYIYIPRYDIPTSDVYKCLNNFLKWYNTVKVEPLYTEKSFSSDEFGGTVDFYGKVNGKWTIVDYKTSKQIRLSMFIQLALYCILLKYHNLPVEQVGIVLINNKSGGHKFLSIDEMDKYIKVAKLLIKLFHEYYNLNEEYSWDEEII